jgi:hypothetical protein
MNPSVAEKKSRTDLQVRPTRQISGIEAVSVALTAGEISTERGIVPFFNKGRTWRSVLPQIYATFG